MNLRALDGKAVIALVTSGEIKHGGLIVPITQNGVEYAPLYGAVIASGIEGLSKSDIVLLPQNWEGMQFELRPAEKTMSATRFSDGQIAKISAGAIIAVKRGGEGDWLPFGHFVRIAPDQSSYDYDEALGPLHVPDRHNIPNFLAGKVEGFGEKARGVPMGVRVGYRYGSAVKCMGANHKNVHYVPDEACLFVIESNDPGRI